MKRIRTAVVTLTLSLLAAAICSAAGPQMGTWRLNEAKSKMPAGMVKNNTVTYTEKGDKVEVRVEGMDKDGKPTKSVWLGKWDGKSYPTKGNGAWNSVAYKVVNDRTNDITAWKDGKVAWTGRITVAADGRSRTVTMNGSDEREEVQRQSRLR